jgi:hypothetical protein
MRLRYILMAGLLAGACSAPTVDNGQANEPEASVPTVAPANNVAVADKDEPAEPASCEAAIGRGAADALVERCLAVSPATRPPCNVANACAMIQEEIDRSCAMFDGDRPAECSAPTATAG